MISSGDMTANITEASTQGVEEGQTLVREDPGAGDHLMHTGKIEEGTEDTVLAQVMDRGHTLLMILTEIEIVCHPQKGIPVDLTDQKNL